MNYNIYPPSNELKNIVKQYIIFNSLESIEKILFLPNGGSYIIFNTGASINSKLFGTNKIHIIPQHYSFTFKTNKVKNIFLNSNYDYDNEKYPIIVVELLPIGLFKLFNIDMSLVDFKYQEIEEDIIEHFFSELYSFKDIDEELIYLNKSLEELNNSHNNSYLPVEKIVDKIYNDFNLDIKIEDILKDFDYTRRT